MGKRVLSMILALVLCVSLLPISVFAATEVASGICGDSKVNDGKNVTWSLSSDGVLTISGTGDMADWPTVSNIPRPNTPWISQEETVKTVVIESGVTSIGNYAFYRCVALTSVTIPDSITRIGSNAFYGCKSLTSVTIPDSVKNIGTGTFLHCASLTAITVGNGNTAYRDIDGVLFSSDGTLLITYPTGKTAQTYRIPTGVTSIGASAFAFCNALTSVTIPSSVTNIGYAAFNGYIETIALTDIYFGGSEAEWNTAIGENDIGLADTVTIHYSSSIVYTVTWMNDGVLMGTTEVAYGQMPSYNGETPTKAATAEKIYTFDGWSPLVTAVTSDVTYNATFKESDRLYTITFKDDDGGVLATKRYKYLETPEFSNPTKEPTVSQTFRFVGWAEAFSPVDGNKTYVANFEASPRKYTIRWVDGNGIIIQTEQLPFGTIPTYNGVTPTKTADSQYTFTFGGWSPAIKSVTGDATYTAQFDILDNGSGVGAIVDGGYCGKGNDWEKLIWTLDDTGTLTISGSGAMKNYSATSSRAPWYSKRNSIQTVVMESGVTAIGNSAFSDCSGLTSVSIPNSVTNIGEFAFHNCSSLTSVTIPGSVTSIGYYAFYDCDSLTDVYYTGSEAQYDQITGSGKPAKHLVHFNSTMPIPDSLDFDESYTMTVGSTINISAMFTGNESPSGREVRWSSSDKAVYPAGETSFLAMQDTEPNIHWAYSRPVSASKAGTYTVTLKVGDLSATTQIVVTDPGAELRGELSTGGEIAFVLYPEPGSEAIGNMATGTEDNPFLVTALIPGGASLTGDDDVQWFIYDSSVDDPSIERQITDTLTMGEAGEVYSTVSGRIPKAGSTVRLHLQLSDGRTAWYYIESVAKKNEKVAKIEEFERPLYSVCFPTATRTFTLFPGRPEEVFMYVENRRFERLTGDERDKISSIVWESSNCHVVAFSEDGSGSITKEAVKKWGPWNLWGTDEDSVKLYAGDIPGTAKITCTVTVDGVQYQGSLDVTLLSYEAESLDAKAKQWVSAYEEYTKAVEKAMNKAAKAGGETASVEEIGIDLQAADESREEIDRMVHFNPGKKNPAISKLVYQALADYFSRYIPHNSDFSKIDVSKGITSTATSIVKEVAMSYRHINESYDSGVNLSGSGYGDAFYMFISYKGEQVATITGIKNAQKTMEAFLTSLVELDKNLINQAYKEALKEVFTTDLSHAILSGVKKKLTTALDQYAGVFFRSGAGNAAQMLKNCLDYYDYVKKISNAASYGASDPTQAVNAIKQIKFDYSTTSIRDAAVEASANKLKSAANGITEWLDKWSNGKPLPKAAIEVWKLVWSFQCPVNVAIFDSSGTQIGYVGEDDIWYDADRIYIENYGDEKQIYSNGEVLTFKVVGEDYGVMNCSFSEYDDGAPVRRVNYYDIPIEEGAEISVLSTDGGIAEKNLTVSTDDAVFSANEVIDAADYEDSTVVIRCLLSDKNGGEVLGSGSHVRGDMVTLQAFSNEGYCFTGWMGSNGNLLSTSPIYEFTARENRTITAVFSEDIQIGESDNAVIYGVKAGKSSNVAYVIATVAPLSETTLNVCCAFYNEYGKMIDVQTKSVTEKEEIAFSGDNVEASMAKMFVLGEQYAPQCFNNEIHFD